MRAINLHPRYTSVQMTTLQKLNIVDFQENLSNQLPFVESFVKSKSQENPKNKSSEISQNIPKIPKINFQMIGYGTPKNKWLARSCLEKSQKLSWAELIVGAELK